MKQLKVDSKSSEKKIKFIKTNLWKDLDILSRVKNQKANTISDFELKNLYELVD